MTAKKLTLVNLWASWCEPCKAEFPSLLKLQEKYGTKGFQVLFVSMDSKSAWEDARRFLDEQHVDFQTYVSAVSPQELGADLDSQWEGAIPASFLFNTEGKRIDSWQGEHTFEEIEAKIRPFLTP